MIIANTGKGDKAMKICPVCRIKYDDKAESCAKCRAILIPYEEEAEAPFDKKRLWTAILWTCGFMAVVAGLYYLIGFLTK